MGFLAAGIAVTTAWIAPACTPVVRTFGGSGGGGGTSSTGGSGGTGGGPVSCMPGEKVDCYDGPPGTAGVGSCLAGKALCGNDGKPGTCEGEVTPAQITPANCVQHMDVDCDGVPDRCPLDPIYANGYPAATGGQNAVHGVAVDAAGNVIVTGFMDGQVDFGMGAMGPPGGGNDEDVFLVKVDPTGKTVWAKRYGDTSRQEAWAAGADQAGNVYFAGGYEGTMNTEALVLPTSAGGMDAFLIKMDPNGNATWQRTGGDASDQSVRALAVAPTGGVVVAGLFTNYLTWTGGGQGLYCPLSNCAFIQRFDDKGTSVFSVGTSAPGAGDGGVSYIDHEITGVAVDANDDVIVAGYYDGQLSFDGTSFYTAVGGDDAFVAKLDGKTGAVKWVQTFATQGSEQVTGVAVDSQGNVVIGGSFQGSLTLGSIPLSTPGTTGLFLAKLAGADGSAMWANGYGAGQGLDRMFVGVGPGDDITVSGFFDGTLSFGGDMFDATIMGQSSLGVFVAKLGPTASHIASKAFLPSAPAIVAFLGMGLQPGKGTIAVAGATTQPIDLGTGVMLGQPMIADPLVATYAP
jgi:hypothetical protein